MIWLSEENFWSYFGKLISFLESTRSSYTFYLTRDNIDQPKHKHDSWHPRGEVQITPRHHLALCSLLFLQISLVFFEILSSLTVGSSNLRFSEVLLFCLQEKNQSTKCKRYIWSWWTIVFAVGGGTDLVGDFWPQSLSPKDSSLNVCLDESLLLVHWWDLQ